MRTSFGRLSWWYLMTTSPSESPFATERTPAMPPQATFWAAVETSALNFLKLMVALWEHRKEESQSGSGREVVRAGGWVDSPLAIRARLISRSVTLYVSRSRLARRI